MVNNLQGIARQNPFSLRLPQCLRLRLAEKVKTLQVPDYWCVAMGECACGGCANRMLTWAEYECWHK